SNQTSDSPGFTLGNPPAVSWAWQALNETMETPTQTMPGQLQPAPAASPSPTPSSQRTIQTAQLVAAMLKARTHVTDLIFYPGRAPQIEVSRQLVDDTCK